MQEYHNKIRQKKNLYFRQREAKLDYFKKNLVCLLYHQHADAHSHPLRKQFYLHLFLLSFKAEEKMKSIPSSHALCEFSEPRVAQGYLIPFG